jgi:hypothetical protein
MTGYKSPDIRVRVREIPAMDIAPASEGARSITGAPDSAARRAANTAVASIDGLPDHLSCRRQYVCRWLKLGGCTRMLVEWVVTPKPCRRNATMLCHEQKSPVTGVVDYFHVGTSEWTGN